MDKMWRCIKLCFNLFGEKTYANLKVDEQLYLCKLKGDVIIVVLLVISYTGSVCVEAPYPLVIEVLKLLFPVLNDLSPL